MDIISYSLSKKIAASAVSGVSSMSVDGTTLNIDTNDGQRLQMVFPTPKDGVSVTGVSDKGDGTFTLLLSDGSETSAVQTIKGVKGDKGNPGGKGDPGADGYTPVKGTDYWTADDIAEIQSYIDTQIGGALNGSY